MRASQVSRLPGWRVVVGDDSALREGGVCRWKRAPSTPDRLVQGLDDWIDVLAELLGLTRQGVDYLVRNDPMFPAPVAVLHAGRIWEREAIESWARAEGRIE